MSDLSPVENQSRSALSVLRNREFAIFWSGQAVSLTGTWMQALAQNWVVVGLTTSGFALGLLNFTSSMPMLALTLIGGVIADRMDKRKILIVTQAILMALALVMAALIATHTLRLWHIYLLSFFNGVANAYDMPANQALTPELVRRDEIPQAIALNQAIFNGSRIVGPALAGVLIGWVGLASAFLANGLSFLAVIGSLMAIHSRPLPEKRTDSASPLQSMREGFAYVKERPRLIVLMGLLALTSFLIFPNLAILLPLYAKVALRVDAKALGLLMGSSGVGALIGSLLLLNVRKEERLLRIGLGIGSVTLALAILSLSHNLYLSCLGTFFNSLGLSNLMGLASTIIQEVVPNQLRGRVMSLNSLTFVGIMPFASLFITGFADLIGLRNEMLVCAILYGAIGFSLFRAFAASPEISDYVPSFRTELAPEIDRTPH
jgi:MFS family permease